MNLNCLWKSCCSTGSIRFSVSMELSISSSKKSFGCCTGSIFFSVSMALSISSSKNLSDKELLFLKIKVEKCNLVGCNNTMQ